MFECVLSDLLKGNLRDRAEHVAIVDGSVQVTYRDLAARVEQAAAWLTAKGIQRGDRVGVHLNKSVEEVVAMFAAWRIGAVMVQINHQWTAAQLDYVLRDCDVKALFIDARPAVALATAEIPSTLQHVCVKGKTPEHAMFVAWASLPQATTLPPTPGIDTDLAALLYTSGSTGKPKGVMLTHLNIIAGARSVARYLEATRDDRLLSLLPFSFDYGLNQLMQMCLVGGTVVLQKVMMPAEIAKALARYEITGFAAVPPVWIPLTQYLTDQPGSFPSLRYITNSGGKIPPSTLELMPRAYPGVKIFLMYGLTEAFRSTYLPPELFESKMGSMGRAIPNAETYIIKEDGVAGPGEQGELVHRGCLISLGYWGKPEATAEKIRVCPQLRHLIGEEKVCYSGDLVRIDEDGYYWFVSRADFMIKCSGFRISPTEVEDVVSKSGMVTHVVAFGAPDDLNGQVVEVAVTSNGHSFDEQSLMAHCKQNMPHYMVPRKIHLWFNDMPRTGSGKLDRPAIVKQCLGM
ncbi:MAG: AMP-binding protein [Phycisphaeraceae bacterium]